MTVREITMTVIIAVRKIPMSVIMAVISRVSASECVSTESKATPATTAAVPVVVRVATSTATAPTRVPAVLAGSSSVKWSII